MNTRLLLAGIFNLPNSNNVIFTSGCTESLNLAILGSIKKGGHVITTIFEHNSVLRPLFKLKKDGLIDVTFVEPDRNNGITLKQIKKALKPNTYMLVVNHVSNVTGHTVNLAELGDFAKQNNLLFLVDSAQSAGHIDIDVQKNNINLLAIAGHKGLHSPQGVGALLINNTNPQPIKFGGTGLNSEEMIQPLTAPEAYEAGTTCTPLIFGLKKGVEWTFKNLDKINKKTKALCKQLLTKLQQIEEVTLYTNPNCPNGIVSFNIKGMHSNDVANELNSKYKICVRSGLHCAPLVHKHFNTLNSGMVRASIGSNNKKADIKKLISAVKKIIKDN